MFLVVHFPISAMIASKITSLCQNFPWGAKKPLVLETTFAYQSMKEDLVLEIRKTGMYSALQNSLEHP